MVRRNNNGKVLTLEDLDGGAKSVAWDPKGEFLAAAGAHRLYGNIYQNKLLLRGGGGGESHGTRRSVCMCHGLSYVKFYSFRSSGLATALAD